MGGSGTAPQNNERDFLRFARRDLGADFQLYMAKCIAFRRGGQATADMDIGVLLPREVAHWLWPFNREKFGVLSDRGRILEFLENCVERNEEWWQRHPLREEAVAAPDRGKHLPLQPFGDDGCLRKTRVMRTFTWYPATWTPLAALHSRIPTYLIPQHVALKDITDSELQRCVVWSFLVWMSGRMPTLDHCSTELRKGSMRNLVGERHDTIAGWHVGVFVGTIADALWMAQHYRWSSCWSSLDSCFRCFAWNDGGALDSCHCKVLPQRQHDDYMKAAAGVTSPLASIPGYHISLSRGEGMHTGPLGCLPDCVASALIEHCGEGTFGCETLTPWEFKLQAQLNVAYAQFCVWTRANFQEHTIKAFTRLGFSKSFPFSKGKAHNVFVAARWIETICAVQQDVAPYCRLRWQVLWA